MFDSRKLTRGSCGSDRKDKPRYEIKADGPWIRLCDLGAKWLSEDRIGPKSDRSLPDDPVQLAAAGHVRIRM